MEQHCKQPQLLVTKRSSKPYSTLALISTHKVDTMATPYKQLQR